MNKFKYYINILIFFTAIFLISIINLISPKNETVSETENRALAGKPSYSNENLLSGQYFRDFESYFADHFLKREILVQKSKDISSLKGIQREEEVFLVDYDGQNVGGGESQEEQEENDDTKDEEKEIKDKTEPATKGNLLILNDTVMEIYKFNEASSKSYANMINTVKDKMGDDVKVYSLIAPIQIEFLENKKYKDLSDSQLDCIEFLKSNFSKDIISVDAYKTLHDHIDEYVYYRTDHHWTALGAYYGYTGFAETAGFEAVPLDEYKKEVAPGFLGHLSTINPSEKVNDNPDDVVYYNPPVKSSMEVFYYDKETGEKKSYEGAVISKSYLDTDQKYGVFIGGDFPLGVIKTNAGTDKKIMVIKDSYGNSFIPFLVAHYSEIYVVDPRHYKESIINLAHENGINEVLFVNYILTTNFQAYMDSVLKLTE